MNASSTSALTRPCVVIATALLILALNLSFGAAVVTAAADDDIPGSAFVLGSTVGGTVDPSTDPSDVYCIHLNAGDEIRIECMPTATSSDANPKKGHLSFLAPGVPSLAGFQRLRHCLVQEPMEGQLPHLVCRVRICSPSE